MIPGDCWYRAMIQARAQSCEDALFFAAGCDRTGDLLGAAFWYRRAEEDAEAAFDLVRQVAFASPDFLVQTRPPVPVALALGSLGCGDAGAVGEAGVSGGQRVCSARVTSTSFVPCERCAPLSTAYPRGGEAIVHSTVDEGAWRPRSGRKAGLVSLTDK